MEAGRCWWGVRCLTWVNLGPSRIVLLTSGLPLEADPSDQKIGEIKDVLVANDGKIAALIVEVGGFIGAGAKDVAVPFADVKGTKKNDKWYLTMQASKDDLKNAPGMKYDRTSTKWVPENK